MADVTEIAIDTPTDERTTIAIVSGDADVIPALDKILQRERWKIEIFMWNHAIARKLRTYATKHKDRLEIKPLDAFFDKATFTNMKFPFKNRQLISVVRENGIALSMAPNAFRNGIPDKTWCTRLESIAQWPFQYYWFEIENRRTNNLIVVFASDRGRKFDIPGFLEDIAISNQDSDVQDPEGKYHLRKVESAQPFLKFIHEEAQLFDAALEQVGNYVAEDVNAGYENDTTCVSDSEEKFSIIHRRKRRQQRYSDLCAFKFNCSNGTSCYYKHTEEEKQYFYRRSGGRGNPMRGNPMRKTEMCKFYDPVSGANQCRKEKSKCDYAHGVDDAWCLQCRSSGHFQKDCPSC